MTDRFVVNQNEFFNRRVGPVYYVGGPTPGGLAETEVRSTRRRRSSARRRAARARSATCSLEGTISPDGVVVARDPGLGLTLWRLDGPLVATTTEINGLYPNDTWSGKHVTWTRERCRGGTLTVSLSSDPNLFDEDQIVTAS